MFIENYGPNFVCFVLLDISNKNTQLDDKKGTADIHLQVVLALG